MQKRYLKNFIVLTLLFCLPTGTFAKGLYNTFTASVPVSFVSENNSDGCRIIMETKNNSPEPHESEITLSDGGEEEFKIDISEPGTYHYSVYEQKGENNNITYDDTVYSVTIFVTVNTNDTLKYAVTAASSKSPDKPDKIEFKNKETGAGGNGGGNGNGGGDNNGGGGSNGGGTSEETGRNRGGGKSTPINKREVTTTAQNTERTDEDIPEQDSEEEIVDDPQEDIDNNIIEENQEQNTEPDNDGTDSDGRNRDDSGNIAVNENNDPPTEDSKITEETAVNTGDSSKQELWIALMCASSVIYILSVIAEKNSKKQKGRRAEI